jgi:hypothetical protein
MQSPVHLEPIAEQQAVELFQLLVEEVVEGGWQEGLAWRVPLQTGLPMELEEQDFLGMEGMPGPVILTQETQLQPRLFWEGRRFSLEALVDS